MKSLTKNIALNTAALLILTGVCVSKPLYADGFGLKVGPNFGQAINNTGGLGKDGDHGGYNLGINYLTPKVGPVACLIEAGILDMGFSLGQYGNNFNTTISCYDISIVGRTDLIGNTYFFAGGFVGFTNSAKLSYNSGAITADTRSYYKDTLTGYKAGFGAAFHNYEFELGWMSTVGGITKSDGYGVADIGSITLDFGYRF